VFLSITNESVRENTCPPYYQKCFIIVATCMSDYCVRKIHFVYSVIDIELKYV
jgi:hypothetical protein